MNEQEIIFYIVTNLITTCAFLFRIPAKLLCVSWKWLG